MASADYAKWVKDGKPWKLAKPVADFTAILRKHTYTVWTYPDERHQKAEPPEDHTAYSHTGWPVNSAYPVGHAMDVKDQAEPFPLWQVAEQIIRDKDAGVAGTEWIKYLNYTDKAGDCWHVSWQPKKSKTSSTDKGHLHVSARSDKDDKSTTYDPIARLEKAQMPTVDEYADAVIKKLFTTPVPGTDTPGHKARTLPTLLDDNQLRDVAELEKLETVKKILDDLTAKVNLLIAKASDGSTPS